MAPSLFDLTIDGSLIRLPLPDSPQAMLEQRAALTRQLEDAVIHQQGRAEGLLNGLSVAATRRNAESYRALQDEMLHLETELYQIHQVTDLLTDRFHQPVTGPGSETVNQAVREAALLYQTVGLRALNATQQTGARRAARLVEDIPDPAERQAFLQRVRSPGERRRTSSGRDLPTPPPEALTEINGLRHIIDQHFRAPRADNRALEATATAIAAPLLRMMALQQHYYQNRADPETLWEMQCRHLGAEPYMPWMNRLGLMLDYNREARNLTRHVDAGLNARLAPVRLSEDDLRQLIGGIGERLGGDFPVILEDLLTSGRIELRDRPHMKPRAHVQRYYSGPERTMRPYVYAPQDGSPADAVILAHELGHYAAAIHSGSRAIPSGVGECYAFLFEALAVDILREMRGRDAQSLAYLHNHQARVLVSAGDSAVRPALELIIRRHLDEAPHGGPAGDIRDWFRRFLNPDALPMMNSINPNSRLYAGYLADAWLYRNEDILRNPPLYSAAYAVAHMAVMPLLLADGVSADQWRAIGSAIAETAKSPEPALTTLVQRMREQGIAPLEPTGETLRTMLARTREHLLAAGHSLPAMPSDAPARTADTPDDLLRQLGQWSNPSRGGGREGQ